MRDKIYNFLNKDIKEYNLKLIFLASFVFLFLVGIISYKAVNHTSYALFTDEVEGTKTITLHYDAPKTVTFDPDGGTIPEGTDWTGSGNTATKEVTKGLTYGELPEPTKEGYTFKGWNGKNLIGNSNLNIFQEKVLFNENQIIFDGSDYSENNMGAIRIQKSINGTYPSGDLCNFDYSTAIIGNKYNCTFTKSSSFDNIAFRANTSKYDPVLIIEYNNFIDSNSYTISYTLDSFNRTDSIAKISSLQLEKGSTATEYEPYYITEDTKVVQTTNHTLKAIWEEEEETQTEP